MSGGVIERRWLELGPLFDAAWDLDAEARARFIEDVGDVELRTGLARLLAEAADASPLDAGSGRFAAALVDAEPGIEGSRLGSWRVGALIGSGGMASVFSAERDDGAFAQKVAIKILRYGVHDRSERERFVRERRILARLDHPHIARLLDGGFTEAGVPWFALEYVDGDPVTVWCDRQKLGLDARLRLFIGVCGAVAYAHRNLIVHRDLKPGNILIREDGTLKLLDFGIAKLLDDESAGHTVVRMLTPAYAAPEQYGDALVTTAADVYALGVLLHELLVGVRPRWRDDATLIPASSFVTGPTAEAAAGARNSDPRSLRRRVGGELQLILAKALQPDPALRYAGADELARDLEHHLAGLPISARADSRRYRFSRFVRRHRLGIALAAGFLVVILVGIGATLWQARTAQQEAVRANATRDFVLALFEGVTPDESKGRDVSARELLDRGAARLGQTLAERPALEAQLAGSLAAAYRQLGAFEQADVLVERALQRAGKDASRAPALAERGRLRAAQGRLEEAEADVRAAIAAGPPQRAERELLLARILSERGQLVEARELVERVLDEARERQPEIEMQALTELGGIRFHAGELGEAAAALTEAVALRGERNGEEHTATATAVHDLGVVVLQQGDAAAATELFGRALATRRKLLGAEHPDVADSEFNLGTALRQRGDLAGAAAHIEHATAMQERLLGEAHPAIANGYNSLALVAYAEGDFARAIEGFRKAIDSARLSYGDRHPTLTTMFNNLAGLERSVGRLDAAERDARSALASASLLGPAHYLVGVARLGLGTTLIERDSLDEGLAELRQAHAELSAALGPDHSSTLLTQAVLAIAHLRQNDLAHARELAEDAAERGAASFPLGHPQLGKLYLAAARVARADRRCSDALELLEQAQPLLAAGGATTQLDRVWAGVEAIRCRPASSRAERQQAWSDVRAEAAALPWLPPQLAAALKAQD